jgi:hypothetical protein
VLQNVPQTWECLSSNVLSSLIFTVTRLDQVLKKACKHSHLPCLHALSCLMPWAPALFWPLLIFYLRFSLQHWGSVLLAQLTGSLFDISWWIGAWDFPKGQATNWPATWGSEAHHVSPCIWNLCCCQSCLANLPEGTLALHFSAWLCIVCFLLFLCRPISMSVTQPSYHYIRLHRRHGTKERVLPAEEIQVSFF